MLKYVIIFLNMIKEYDMTPHIEDRVVRATLCGLYTPSEVFENNAGLLTLTQYYYLCAKDSIARKLEGVSLLQEAVYIYREKLRTIYRLEVEDKIKINVPHEMELLVNKTDKLLTELLTKHNLSFNLWDIKHKFTEWPTARGAREIGAYADYLYMKYVPR